MLSVTYEPLTLGAIMLNVNMMSVVVPYQKMEKLGTERL